MCIWKMLLIWYDASIHFYIIPDENPLTTVIWYFSKRIVSSEQNAFCHNPGNSSIYSRLCWGKSLSYEGAGGLAVISTVYRSIEGIWLEQVNAVPFSRAAACPEEKHESLDPLGSCESQKIHVLCWLSGPECGRGMGRRKRVILSTQVQGWALHFPPHVALRWVFPSVSGVCSFSVEKPQFVCK